MGDDICKKALAKYGEEHQTMKAFEEFGELMAAISQHRDGRCEKKDVVTEIADVMVMTTQLALIYGYEDVEREVSRKLERLEKRMKCTRV